MTSPAANGTHNILVIDVGGSNLKLLLSGQTDPVKIPSGPTMTGERMVEVVQRATAGWDFDAISIGYPGPVVHGRPFREPWNLGPGWVNLDYAAAFGRPVRIIN